MPIRIVAVGRLKEKYWQAAAAEYQKRLASYTKLEIVEIAEEKVPENPSLAEIEQVKTKEGERIAKYLPPSFFIIPLVIEGRQLPSPDLAQLLEDAALKGNSRVAFIIGGSYGLAEDIIRRGDFLLSFSALTFPHQMMRVILLEQIYRAFSISKGGKYHK